MTQLAASRSPAPSRFAALDSWRGLCALLVAFLHAPFADPFRDAPALDNLQLCVDLFFVLSGFVLMHGYGPRLATGAEARRFALVRFGRLWPLHVVVLAAFVAVEFLRLAAARHGGGQAFALPPFGPGRSGREILDNLLMAQAIGPDGTLSWNFPAGSVAVEFWASLAFAGLVWRFGPRRPLPFLGLALASGAVLHELSPMSPLVIERWGLVRCLCDLSVGCLAYQWRGRIGAARFGGTAAEIAAAGLAADFVVFLRPGPWGVLAPLVCGAVVLVFSFERGALSRLLVARPLQALGRWSFSVYMLHVLVFELVRSAARLIEARTGRTLIVAHGDGQLLTTGSHALDLALALGVLALVVVPLAALSYRFVERPALAAAKALVRSGPRRPAPAPWLTVSRSLP